MPETAIQDFDSAGLPQSGDLMNIQRQTNGVWVNYALPVDAFSGSSIIDETFDIQDLSGGASFPALLPDPPAGKSYMTTLCFLQYTPGSVFDGSLFTFEIDEVSSVVFGSATFNFGPTPSASLLVQQARWNNGADSGLVFAMAGSSLADGQIRVYMEYIMVDV